MQRIGEKDEDLVVGWRAWCFVGRITPCPYNTFKCFLAKSMSKSILGCDVFGGVRCTLVPFDATHDGMMPPGFPSGGSQESQLIVREGSAHVDFSPCVPIPCGI